MSRPKGLDGKAGAELALRRALARVNDFSRATEEALDEGLPTIQHVRAMAEAASAAVAEAGALDVFRFLADGTYRAVEVDDDGLS